MEKPPDPTSSSRKRKAGDEDDDGTGTDDERCIRPAKNLVVAAEGGKAAHDTSVQDRQERHQSSDYISTGSQHKASNNEFVKTSGTTDSGKQSIDEKEPLARALPLSSSFPLQPRPKPEKKRMTDKPKRPMSAYNFFFREQRPKVLREAEAAGLILPAGTTRREQKSALFSDVGRRVAGKWRAISKAELDIYKKMADDDMERYQKEKSEYELEQVRQRNLESVYASCASSGHNRDTNTTITTTITPALVAKKSDGKLDSSYACAFGSFDNIAASAPALSQEASQLIQNWIILSGHNQVNPVRSVETNVGLQSQQAHSAQETSASLPNGAPLSSDPKAALQLLLEGHQATSSLGLNKSHIDVLIQLLSNQQATVLANLDAASARHGSAISPMQQLDNMILRFGEQLPASRAALNAQTTAIESSSMFLCAPLKTSSSQSNEIDQLALQNQGFQLVQGERLQEPLSVAPRFPIVAGAPWASATATASGSNAQKEQQSQLLQDQVYGQLQNQHPQHEERRRLLSHPALLTGHQQIQQMPSNHLSQLDLILQMLHQTQQQTPQVDRIIQQRQQDHLQRSLFRPSTAGQGLQQTELFSVFGVGGASNQQQQHAQDQRNVQSLSQSGNSSNLISVLTQLLSTGQQQSRQEEHQMVFAEGSAVSRKVAPQSQQGKDSNYQPQK